MSRKEKVTRVIDGDTFETASRKNPIRLAQVDTPEKGQPGYQKAKSALNNLIGGQEVTIDTVARDIYGRSVANVRVGRQSVNKKMKGNLKKK
jgi:endonuclease YncB( thermonuclease family)